MVSNMMIMMILILILILMIMLFKSDKIFSYSGGEGGHSLQPPLRPHDRVKCDGDDQIFHSDDHAFLKW